MRVSDTVCCKSSLAYWCLLYCCSGYTCNFTGFQAGVIFASAFILYGLIFGLQRTRRVLPPSVLRWLMSLGVLLYAGTGVVTMLLGGNLLDYDVLAHDPLHGQHWGIFAVELGVGITVTAVMISLFYGFASRR